VSAWLVDDVLAPLGDSFLELGCGAGRNLAALRVTRPDASLAGVEVNEQAAALAGAHAQITMGSVYEIDLWTGRPVDVVFTSGVLMHVPHDRVEEVVAAAHSVAARAVVHFELHGASHDFDFHRYPRDYASLYDRLGFTVDRYEVFANNDFRSAGVAPFFLHALLVSTRR
jgi:trans-aconitate methyltransferase